MYKHLFLLAIVAVGLNACGPVYVVQQTPPPPAPAEAPPPANPEDVSYQTFYDQLSPYGQWVQDPDYGYVWMPEVGPDFKPYATNGHWVYTDEGWAWDSGYPWGWAAFHYGRWFFRDGYGWMWIPGNEWAPAWVSWRNSDDYYGWAPMEPGISVSVAYSSGYNPPPHYWCFVPHQYVASPQINNYYVRETNNVTIINRTTVINNTTVINHYGNNRYGAGPDPGEVGRFSGAPLRPAPVRESRAPGGNVSGGGFAVYRPHVNSAPPAGDSRPGNNGRPGGYAPANFHPLNMARPVNRTNYGANSTPPAGYDNRGYDNRGNDNRGNGYDNRGNGNDNRGGNNGNHNGWDNNNGNNGNNGNHNGWNGNNGNNNGNRGNGQSSGVQPVNGQPTNGQPANNPPTYNRPPAGGSPVNQGQPNNNPANNGRPFGGAQPSGQPSAQPAGHPSVQQPQPAIRQQQPQRPFGPPSQNANRQRPFGPPSQNANQQRPAAGQPNQNSNQPRPVGNRPKPAPQQHNPPPPQKRDDGQNH